MTEGGTFSFVAMTTYLLASFPVLLSYRYRLNGISVSFPFLKLPVFVINFVHDTSFYQAPTYKLLYLFTPLSLCFFVRVQPKAALQIGRSWCTVSNLDIQNSFSLLFQFLSMHLFFL